MGFRDARERVVSALLSGAYDHDERDALAEKNRLAVGDVTAAEVVRLLRRCRGKQYSSGPHDFDPETTVHVFRPIREGQRWYIKGYFMGGRLILISVHPSE